MYGNQYARDGAEQHSIYRAGGMTMTMTDEECMICCRRYSKAKGAKVACPHCRFECCQSCIRRHLTTTATDLQCMSCKRQWSRSVVVERFPKVFLEREWRARKTQVVSDRERKLLLTETQELVVRRREGIKELEDCHNRYEILLRKHRKYLWLCRRPKQQQQQQQLREKKDVFAIKRILAGKLASIETRIAVLKTTVARIKQGHLPPGFKKVGEFVRQCPVPDCKGYLSAGWKCGMCESWTCSKCLEFMGSMVEKQQHQCREDNLKSAVEIRKHGKRCPSCGVVIIRYTGCPTMFCTNCHVGFDWTTYQILKGSVIYNPHFFEHQRQQQQQQQQQDDLDMDPGWVKQIANGFEPGDRRLTLTCGKHRIHINAYLFFEWVLYRLRAAQDDQDQDQDQARYEVQLRKLRYEYMTGRRTDLEWCRRVYSADKLRDRDIEMSQVLAMYCASATDIMRRLRSQEPVFSPREAGAEMETIEEHAERATTEVCRRYGTRKRTIVSHCHCRWYVVNYHSYAAGAEDL
jgi:hypothetical protein